MSGKLKVLLIIKTLCLILIGVVCQTFTALAATPSGMTILLQMEHASETVSYSARQTTWRKRTPVVITNIWDGGIKKRVEYLAPPVNKGDIQVDDGTHVRRYHRSEHGVVQTPSTRRKPLRNTDFSQHYTVRLLGTATVSGRKTWIIGIVPHGSSKYVRKFWVDQYTHIRLRAELFDVSGQRTEATQLSHLHFGAIPAGKFNWKEPAGAKVNYAGELYSHIRRAQEQVTWLRVPYWLPAGYAFESVVINKSNNEAWLRYTNGSHRFSIFEQRTKDTSNTKPQQVSGGWFWKRSGMRFLIAGLDARNAQKLAVSF